MSEARETATTVVVDRDWPGGVLPSRQLEMDRLVSLKPGARVRGGVYCGELEAAGDVVIEGAVSVRRTVSVALREGARFRASGSIRAGQSILIEGPGSAVLAGNVYARRMRAEGAVIGGNVYVDECYLVNCVVNGFVFCRRLEAERSTMVSFHAEDARLKAGVSIWLPFGFVDRDLVVEAPVRCGYVSSLNAEGSHGGFECPAHRAGGCPECTMLGAEDIHNVPVGVSTTEPDGTEVPAALRPRGLSLAPRLLGLQRLASTGLRATMAAVSAEADH